MSIFACSWFLVFLLEQSVGIRRDVTQLADITAQNSTGESCQCVPYYLCDKNLEGVHLADPAETKYGRLDLKFGEGRICEGSVEKCCTEPVPKETVPLPAPDPSRLKGCGYRNPNGLDFTFTAYNHEAKFGEFPWVVAVMDSVKDSYHGAGVLIHPQVVLTAAHIASKFIPGIVKIRAGEWDMQTTQERLQHQERMVSEMVMRPDYTSFNLNNDIALFRLEHPVQLSDHINVACLPEQGDNPDNYVGCIADGWGKDSFGENERYVAILKKVVLDMVPRDRCVELLQNTRLGRFFQLDESMVCAGGHAGIDTCQGDGGAPLVCPVGDNRYKVTGLVAYGIGCGKADVPAVYANVAKFRTWIDMMVEDWGFNTTVYTL